MTYTTHGHEIPNTIHPGERPDRIARCGGPGLCAQCSMEASAAQPKAVSRFGNVNEGEPENFSETAKQIVMHQYNEAGIGTPRGEDIKYLEPHEVYVVWFSKTLQNWKALVSTTRPDDRYYEVTYNGNLGEAYVDTYLKTHNIVYSNAEFSNN